MKHFQTLLFTLFILLFNSYSIADEKIEPQDPAIKVTSENCTAPKWAIAIGHEDKWKLHNGCAEEPKKNEK